MTAPAAPTKILFTLWKIYAILTTERRWEYEKGVFLFRYIDNDIISFILRGKLVWQYCGCSVVFCCSARFADIRFGVFYIDVKNV